MWGAEITAWDLFLGLSLLCAAPVFAGRQYAMVRRGLLLSGSLCLAGLLGPALNTMAWRQLGIFGYAVVLPLTCLALSRAFATASTPLNGKRRREDSAISQEANTPLTGSDSSQFCAATVVPRLRKSGTHQTHQQQSILSRRFADSRPFREARRNGAA